MRTKIEREKGLFLPCWWNFWGSDQIESRDTPCRNAAYSGDTVGAEYWWDQPESESEYDGLR
jgi:hypothetical protein